MRTPRFMYTVYDENNKMVLKEVGVGKVAELLGVHAATVKSLGVMQRTHKGYRVVIHNWFQEAKQDYWYCQNRFCPTRGKERYDEPVIVKDDFKGELKLCKSCRKAVN